MILVLPTSPRLKVHEIDTNDHKEFDGVEVVGEPIGIGVRTPNTQANKYIIKQGYTYMWENYRLYDGSEFYAIWLLYPKGKRPIEIEIEDYKEGDIIDAFQYEQMIKSKRREMEGLKKNDFWKPEKGEQYWIPILDWPHEAISKVWQGYSEQYRELDCGLVCKTEKEACNLAQEIINFTIKLATARG